MELRKKMKAPKKVYHHELLEIKTIKYLPPSN